MTWRGKRNWQGDQGMSTLEWWFWFVAEIGILALLAVLLVLAWWLWKLIWEE